MGFKENYHGGRHSLIEAEDGYDVFLTIDVNIQSITERHLSQAVRNNQADSRSCHHHGSFNRKYSING